MAVRHPESLPVARSLTSLRIPAAVLIGGLVAMGGSVVGILGNGGGVSTWDWTALSGAFMAFAVVTVQSILDFRDARRSREVVVNLITAGTKRELLDDWTKRGHVRGILDLYAVFANEKRNIATFAVRYGQLVLPSQAPSLTLRAETSGLPNMEGFLGYEIRFEPDSEDWHPRVADLYDKDDRDDALFDVMRANKAEGLDIVPEVLVYTPGLRSRVDEFLLRSIVPERVSRIDRLYAVGRALPSLFNVTASITVSVSGYPTLRGDVQPPMFREEFALLSRLDRGGTWVTQHLEYSSRFHIRPGPAAVLPPFSLETLAKANPGDRDAIFRHFEELRHAYDLPGPPD